MSKDLFVTCSDFFEETALKNPIKFNDIYLENKYPDFLKTNYGVRIIVAKEPTKEEREFPIYNDYRDRYGNADISSIADCINNNDATNIFLNGFSQKQFDYIAPLIKEKVKILYLFKCPRIINLSVLSQFSKLECVLIYWNNSLETLWHMENNKNLKVLSFSAISKLKDISTLTKSSVEYINFHSMYPGGSIKEMLFDKSILYKIPNLKQLHLTFNKIDEHIITED